MPIPTPKPRPRPLRGRRAFTLIELLVVIAIIALISGILVVGLSSVSAGRQRDQTVAMLKRLDNAMTELTTSPAGSFKMYTIQLPNIYFPPDTTGVYAESQYKNWIGVPATALESQVRTALVLQKIVSTNPSGKQFLADLPPEQKKLINWNVTIPGSASLVPTGKTRPEYTMPLDAWGNPILFVFDGLLIPTGTNVGRAFSVDVGGTNTYVGGLTYLFVGSDKSFYKPTTDFTPAPTYPMVSNTDMPNASENISFAARVTQYSQATPAVTHVAHVGPTGQIETTVRSPDHKPFWVSAGPDGKYDTHDDNVYSFGH